MGYAVPFVSACRAMRFPVTTPALFATVLTERRLPLCRSGQICMCRSFQESIATTSSLPYAFCQKLELRHGERKTSVSGDNVCSIVLLAYKGIVRVYVRGCGMVLETERLILRPWEEGDAESLYEYARSPDVGPIAGWPPHTSVENSLQIIREVLSAEETYAVCLREDDRAIGSIGLRAPMQALAKNREDETEVGFWIGVPFWGRGLIPEAVGRPVAHAFEDLGYRAVWCGYFEGNDKSKRCQEKCGFRFHHVEENVPCRQMGDVRTEYFSRLTREDWARRTRATRAKA